MKNRLDDHAALILIDLQRGMFQPGPMPRNNPQAEACLAQLLACWRATTRPVVHVRHMSREPASRFWPGQPNAEFEPAFAPLAHEQVVEKNVPDAFAASGLERWLRVRHIAQLVIAGVVTNNSLEATARSAGNLGFTTVVASDAAFTYDMHDLTGRLWRAEDIHALSLANLAMDYATVLDTAAIVALAQPGS